MEIAGEVSRLKEKREEESVRVTLGRNRRRQIPATGKVPGGVASSPH